MPSKKEGRQKRNKGAGAAGQALRFRVKAILSQAISGQGDSRSWRFRVKASQGDSESAIPGQGDSESRRFRVMAMPSQGI